MALQGMEIDVHNIDIQTDQRGAYEKVETVFMKCTSIPWKGSGLSCVPGCDHIEAFRRRKCRDVSVYLHSFTIFADVGKLCFITLLAILVAP